MAHTRTHPPQPTWQKQVYVHHSTHCRSPFLRALQRQNSEISKQIFPEKEYEGLSPNFHIDVSVIDLYIPRICLPILLVEICGPLLGLYKWLTDT
jgi:hypothetical protein